MKKFQKYYREELDYLRDEGQVFAKLYPEIASHLGISSSKSFDPHVERLIESFAFISSRLHIRIDESYQELMHVLLQRIAPNIISPLPITGIVNFQIDNNISKSIKIPKGTALYNDKRQFKTCYSFDLHPITIEDVYIAKNYSNISSKNFIVINIKALADIELSEIQLHITGNDETPYLIYENIFTKNSSFVKLEDKSITSEIIARGFEREDSLFDIPNYVTHVNFLLQEFFYFPEKFFFFNVKFQKIKLKAKENFSIFLEIFDLKYFGFHEINNTNFQLHCTPVVNLFECISDPIKCDEKKIHYEIIPDAKRDLKIYSIKEVYRIDQNGKTSSIQPFFGVNIFDQDASKDIFWIFRKENLPSLSFVDINFNPSSDFESIVYVKLICEDNFFYNEIFEEGHLRECELQSNIMIPVSKVSFLGEIRSKNDIDNDFNMESNFFMKIISVLNSNNLTSVNLLNSIINILESYSKLFGSYDFSIKKNILDITTSKTTRRIGNESWRGFVHGLEITIKTKQIKSIYFLLFSVLRYFLSLSADVNSFIELVWESDGTERMRWKPSISLKNIL